MEAFLEGRIRRRTALANFLKARSKQWRRQAEQQRKEERRLQREVRRCAPAPDQCPNRTWREQFRLLKDDVEKLLAVLDLPDPIRCDDGSVASARDALLMLLRRLCDPARLCDIELMFGWERTRFGRFARTTADAIWRRWHHLLAGDTMRLTPEKLVEFARIIHAKGAPLSNCWAFLDGRRKRHLRPVRNQRIVYNGWLRGHCQAYQSLDTPDGMHVHVFGPVEGRRHDTTVFKESGLSHWLEEHSHGPNGESLVIYGDAGYALTNHVIVPYKGARLTPAQELFNLEMSRVREAVEWGFSSVTRQWAFLNNTRQRLLLEPIALWYLVGTILANARNCLYPNQTAQYFQCDPPSLEEYFVGYPDDYIA